MIITALALTLGLALQDQTGPETGMPAADAAPALEGALEDTPPPPPTDAATLIAQIEGGYTAYGELAAQLAARQARERFMAELLLPVISRSDLDDGAQGEILSATAATITELEETNTRWAVRQLDPEQIAILYAEQPRLARQVLRLAERDASAEPRIIAALEPVAFNGGIDGAAYAERTDNWLIENRGHQLYGTQSLCADGRLEPFPSDMPDTLDDRRLALGLPTMDEAWTGRAGSACTVEPDAE